MKCHRAWLIARPLTNERGSIIVVALLMVILMAITVIGGSRNSSVEVKIASNKRAKDRNFYIAEGLVGQGVIILENAKDIDSSSLLVDSENAPAGLVSEVVTESTGTVAAGDWEGTQTYNWYRPLTTSNQAWPSDAAWSAGNPRALTDDFDYVMVNQGVSAGDSLGQDGTRVYEYNIRGRSRSGNNDTEISIGYRMRF